MSDGNGHAARVEAQLRMAEDDAGDDDSDDELRYRGVDETPVTPRVLIQYTIYETRSAERVDHYAWDAVSVSGVVDSGPGYERRVVGFAEVPPYTRIERTDDAAAFADAIEDVAAYVHWKPAEPLDATGRPFDGGELV